MRSTYTCLAEHLLRRFKSTSHLPLLSEPLDITEPFVVQTLKRFTIYHLNYHLKVYHLNVVIFTYFIAFTFKLTAI